MLINGSNQIWTALMAYNFDKCKRLGVLIHNKAAFETSLLQISHRHGNIV